MLCAKCRQIEVSFHITTIAEAGVTKSRHLTFGVETKPHP